MMFRNEEDLENDLLYRSFLENTFFKVWSGKSDNPNFESLELQINSHCNLGCTYCYYTNFGEELYSKEISKPETIKSNLLATLKWLATNKYTPKLEIFTGECFAQKIGRDCVDIIYDFYKDKDDSLKPRGICVPTNYTWISDDSLYTYVEETINKFRDIKIPFMLSTSIDGKYLDESNRPMKFEKENRDDVYYDKVFAFNKKYNVGFHPMVYSNKIELWKDNFLWFQDMLKKHNMFWDNIYLLEVRNQEWTDKQIKDFGEFIEFLIIWSWEKCGKKIEHFIDFIFKGRGFNILSAPLSSIGRGLGCSMQSTFYLRLGDMTQNICHRTMYNGFQLGKFSMLDNEIVGIKAVNVGLAICAIGYDFKTQPYCQDCLIKNCCAGGCLGAQYEATGDMFIPIPTVCQVEYAKIYYLIKGLKHIGVYDSIKDMINKDKVDTFSELVKIYENLE